MTRLHTFVRVSLALLVASVVIDMSALSATAGGKPAPGPSYQIVELDSGGGQFEGHPADINNTGLIVGIVNSTAGSSAACWTVNKTDTTVSSELRTMTGDAACSVNDAGQIVGLGDGQAVYWANPYAAPVPLPLPESVQVDYSVAEAIDNDGLICGWYTYIAGTGQFTSVAVVWRVSGGTISDPVELPALFEGDSTSAHALNDLGGGTALVVGQEYETTTGDDVAVLAWTIELSGGTLSVNTTDILDAAGNAYGVNNSGQICGNVLSNAVVWQDTAKTTLDKSGTINRKPIASASAWAVSAGGVIVGDAWASVYQKAVVWSSTGATMVQLDKFLPKRSSFTELNSAQNVNDAGEIVGFGWDNDRSLQLGFLAIPK